MLDPGIGHASTVQVKHFEVGQGREARESCVGDGGVGKAQSLELLQESADLGDPLVTDPRARDIERPQFGQAG